MEKTLGRLADYLLGSVYVWTLLFVTLIIALAIHFGGTVILSFIYPDSDFTILLLKLIYNKFVIIYDVGILIPMLALFVFIIIFKTD